MPTYALDMRWMMQFMYGGPKVLEGSGRRGSEG